MDTESAYTFAEKVYDATQNAMEVGKINVVIANSRTVSIHVAKDFSSYDEAYAYTRKLNDPNEQAYIIGGDIENG